MLDSTLNQKIYFLIEKYYTDIKPGFVYYVNLTIIITQIK